MQAGKLDRRLKFLTATTTRNSFGEEVKAWSDFVEVPARAIPVRGDKHLAGEQRVLGVTMKWQIRWRADLTTDMRVSYEGVEYELLSLAELGRRRGFEVVGKLP